MIAQRKKGTRKNPFLLLPVGLCRLISNILGNAGPFVNRQPPIKNRAQRRGKSDKKEVVHRPRGALETPGTFVLA
jgi:hypothetical protein